MDRVEFSNKLTGLISTGGCWRVKKDPTLKTESKLSEILSKNKDLISQIKYRQLTKHYSKLPHIYGLPKIHKDGIPLNHCQQPISMLRIEPFPSGDHQPING